MSLWPVCNAMLVVLLVMSIYAILGVEFFRDHSVQFSSFSQALFTMFQTATFEGWSILSRSLSDDGETVPAGVAFFFTSYIMVVSWTLLPVVVALLLGNFSKVVSLPVLISLLFISGESIA